MYRHHRSGLWSLPDTAALMGRSGSGRGFYPVCHPFCLCRLANVRLGPHRGICRPNLPGGAAAAKICDPAGVGGEG